MSTQLTESCPVCWREYSASVVPFAGPCGHSICNECSEGVRVCPLCRKKLPSNSQRTPNYSLLSLVTKLSEIPAPQMRDQAAQTEHRPTRPRTAPRTEQPHCNQPAPPPGTRSRQSQTRCQKSRYIGGSNTQTHSTASE